MGDDRYYRKIKQQKVARGGGKQVVPIGGGLYIHPRWARWFGINTHPRRRK